MDNIKAIFTSDRTCQTAEVKFNIKQQEALFLNTLESGSDNNKRLLEIIDTLMAQYRLLYPDFKAVLPVNQRPPSGSIRDYAKTLHSLSAELRRHYESTKRRILLDQLWSCLGNLHYCIAQHAFTHAQISNTSTVTLFHEHTSDSDTAKWFHWLGDLIRIYRLTPGWTTQFCKRLTNPELKHLARSFSSTQYTSLINSVFYFKFHPRELLTETNHPDNLLQIKHQLDDLYSNIQNLFDSLQNACSDRCQLKLANYLYHGSELPDGVTFMALKEHAIIIRDLLKNYPLDIQSDAPNSAPNPAQDFLRAYKFWFNPNRLIDAIMGLWSSVQTVNVNQTLNIEHFSKKIHLYYQKMSTSECVELFAYFTNKDSQYLMRSLHIAASDKDPERLPLCNNENKKSIGLLIKLFFTSVKTLQRELAFRNIQTIKIPAPEVNKPTTFNPGKRNIRAIHHIIKYYSSQEREKNSELENLLLEMENQKK